MQITSTQIKEIKNALQVACIGGIESVIIEDGMLRGANDSRSFAIITNTKIPKFEQKIGITRVSTLMKRLSLFSDDVAANAKETDRGEIAMIEFVAGRNKMQFRCTSSILIKAPKSINDEESFKLVMSLGEKETLINAIKAMNCKTVVLIVDANKNVRFEIKDESNDSFKVELINSVTVDDSCVFSYPSDMITSVFPKLEKDSELCSRVTIGQMGTIKAHVEGHEVTILPLVNEDSGD